MTDFETLIDNLAAEGSPVRVQSASRGRLALAAIAALSVGGVMLLFGYRSDLLTGNPQPLVLVAAGLMLILAVAAGGSAMRMARPQVGAPASGAPWALAALLLLPAIALIGIVANPAAAAGLAVGDGLRCFLVGLAASAATLAFLFVWLRRGAPVSPERASLAAGLAAGAVGALAVTLECPSDALAHLAIWHVAVVIAAGAAARIVLPRFLRW